MATPSSRRFLFLVSCSPWQPRAQALLDLLMTTAVLDQEVHLCFWGDGVLHLLQQQDGDSLQLKTLARQLPALELYGVTHVYAEREALRRHGLDANALVLPSPTLLDVQGLRQLMSQCEIVERCG